MPLKARINGKTVIAPLMTDEEWNNLQTSTKSGKVSIEMPCCSEKGLQKVSKLGTRYFYHKPTPNCNMKAENPEYLKIKAELAQACVKIGWNVDTEVYVNDGYADVLSTDGFRKIAFVVQLRKPSYEDIIKQAENLKDNGIECFWLFKSLPLWDSEETHSDILTNQFTINSHKDDSEKTSTVCKDEREFSIDTFVEAILKKQLKQFDTVTGKYTFHCDGIVIFPYTCWNCHSNYHAYYVKGNDSEWGDISSFETELVTDCGLRIPGMELYEILGDDCEETISLRFDPSIIEAVKQYLNTEEGMKVEMGEIKPRYSNTVKASYMSFGCPHCDAIFGDWYYPKAVGEVENGTIQPTKELTVDITVQSKPVTLPYHHWCFDKEHNEKKRDG